MIRLLLRCAVVGAAALVFAVPDASAQIRLKAGEVRPYFATTPRPYPVGSEMRPVVWTDIVRSPGAT